MKAPQLKQRCAGFPKLVPVGYLDTAQATEILSRQFGHKPGVVIIELPDTKCLTIRADPRTARDAIDLLRRMNKIARGYRGGFDRDAVTIRLSFQDELRAIMGWMPEEESGAFDLELALER